MTLKKANRARFLLQIPLLIGFAVLVYSNTFGVPFVFDGKAFIMDNTHIRRLWPLWDTLQGTARPLTYLTFAVNYHFNEFRPLGYHVVNLTIHVLAGLILFGLIRRLEVACSKISQGKQKAGQSIAFAVALLWLVHPLQTQAVTYIYQRAESLVGFFCLAALYCFVRSIKSPCAGPWQVAAVASCALGVASKPIAAILPVLVLLTDRQFFAGSAKKALMQRRGLYAGLLSSWILAALFLWAGQSEYVSSAGFTQRVGFWAYLRSQPGVLLHYIRLSVWPHPLAFDYGWRTAKQAHQILPQAAVILLLLGFSFYYCRRKNIYGFLGICFFLILAPTSSVIPILDLAVEHRMYLALAPLLALLLLGANHAWLRFVAPGNRWVGQAAGLVLTVATLGLGVASFQRNQLYQSDEVLWRDTVAKRPDNSRAWYGLGIFLEYQGRLDEAQECYRKVALLEPRYGPVQNDLSLVLNALNRRGEALHYLQKALELMPKSAKVHANLANYFFKAGDRRKAEYHFLQSLSADSAIALVHNNYGTLLAQQDRLHEAIREFAWALSIDPGNQLAKQNLDLAKTLLAEKRALLKANDS